MVRPSLLLAAAVVAGCSGQPAKPDDTSPPPSADEAAQLELDEEFVAYREETALPISVPDASAMEALLPGKLERLKALGSSYTEYTDSEDPVASSHANLRVGALYMNLGCELVTMKPNLRADMAQVYQQKVNEAAAPYLTRAKEYLDHAAKTGGGVYADRANELRLAWSDDALKFCKATTSAWAATERPDAPEPTEVTCLGDGAFDATPRCEPIYLESCQAGETEGCHSLGLLAYRADDFEQAAKRFGQACELGKAASCHAQKSISLDSRRDAYIDACKAGDAIGCLQLAKLHGGVEAAHAACEPRGAIGKASGDALTKCVGGDAAACWARAGKLARKKPVDLPEVKVAAVFGAGGLGGALGSLQKKDETTEAREERLTRECAETSASACVGLGLIQRDAGADPIPSFRRACQLGSTWGCSHFATALLKKGDKASVGEAVAVMQSACGDGNSDMCADLGELFHDGKQLPQSDGCAAAYAWQSCTPDAFFGCIELNQTFHPREDAK